MLRPTVFQRVFAANPFATKSLVESIGASNLQISNLAHNQSSNLIKGFATVKDTFTRKQEEQLIHTRFQSIATEVHPQKLEKTLETLSEVRAHTLRTYNAIIQTYGANDHLDEALTIFNKVRQELNPDAYSYAAMINAYATSNAKDAAKHVMQLFEECMNDPVLLTRHKQELSMVCAITLAAFWKLHRLEDLRKVLRYIVEKKIPSSPRLEAVKKQLGL